MKKLFVVVYISLTILAYAGEENVYDFLWLDPDKKVYVLQNREFKKKKRVFFDVNFISNQSSVFQDVSGGQANLGYYFAEEWGIELFYNHYMHSDNDSYDNVKLLNNGEPFVRRFKNAYGLHLIWSPFFGKINTFNKIIYFDWSFALGPVWVSSESNLDTVFDDTKPNVFTSDSSVGFDVKTALKLYLSRSFYFNLEFYRVNYFVRTPTKPDGKELQNETEVALGLGLFF